MYIKLNLFLYEIIFVVMLFLNFTYILNLHLVYYEISLAYVTYICNNFIKNP